MDDAVTLAAKLGGITNLTHGFIYFAPEAAEEYAAVGLPAEHQYFASRGACFGPVPAGVIVATFFNFNPALVHAVIPDAWTLADPAAIQTARMRAAGRVLAASCGAVSDEDIAAASAIAKAMMDGLGDEGRALAAANRAVPEPDDAWELLWQRITVLREWRGDAHVAALVAAPVDAVEALILHAATDQVPKSALVATRQWPEDAWQAGVDRLVSRGLLQPDEQFTDAGRAFREDIERRTNEACVAMVDAVGADDTRRLIDLLKPVRDGLLEGGAFAAMGRGR
ncbi:MAG: hypothetical protein R8F63_08195 [Acidimicrobiales bacterium]|nr:hypothetical protein [Acidimicrobiales bacterium]